MAAARTMKVHVGGGISFYDLSKALADLVRLFWMPPILGLFRLGAQGVMGDTSVVLLVGRADARRPARPDTPLSVVTVR